MSRGHHSNNVGPIPFDKSATYPPSIYLFRAGIRSPNRPIVKPSKTVKPQNHPNLFPNGTKYFHYGADEEDIYGDTDGGGPVVDTGVANLQLDHQSSPLYDSPNPRKTVILVNDIPYSTYRALIYYVSALLLSCGSTTVSLHFRSHFFL
jgi:hypothetical protein